MPLYAIGARVPTIDPEAYVHPEATIIGDVRIGPRSSVWPGAVLRGDHGAIVIGTASSVQDGAVIHATDDLDTVVGDWVVIGHLAHLEGAVAEDRTLIGVGSTVLHRAVIREGATVAAGAVVTNGMEVPAGALAVGIPAQIKLGRSNAKLIQASARIYVDNCILYKSELRRID